MSKNQESGNKTSSLTSRPDSKTGFKGSLIAKDKKNGAEKRIYPRRVLRSQIVFNDEGGEGFVYFYSTDISIGGIFLESDVPLNVNTVVSLTFSLQNGTPAIHAQGKVVRVERIPDDSLPIVGMGLQFSKISDEDKKLIQSYISG